jgi:hypothetical protein
LLARYIEERKQGREDRVAARGGQTDELGSTPATLFEVRGKLGTVRTETNGGLKGK